MPRDLLQGHTATMALAALFAGAVAIAFAPISVRLSELGPTATAFSSVGLLLQPAVAALLAWWLLAEALSAWQAVGGAVILAGIVLARRVPERSEPPINRHQSACSGQGALCHTRAAEHLWRAGRLDR